MLNFLPHLKAFLPLVRRPLVLGLLVALALVGAAACGPGEKLTLNIEKTVEEAGEERFTFTIKVTNRKAPAAFGIGVVDTVPAELQIVSADSPDGTPEIDGQTVRFSPTKERWSLTESFSLTIVTECVRAGSWTNRATVNAFFDGVQPDETKSNRAQASGECKEPETPEATPTPSTEAVSVIRLESILLGVLHGTSTSDIIARICLDLGLGDPVEGATVNAGLTGTAVVDSTASGTTGAGGCADLTFGIRQVGSYIVTLDSVSGPEGTEYDPDAQDVETSASIEVTGEEQLLD